MKLSKICNSKVILADDIKILEKNNVVIDGSIILTFIGKEDHQKKIYNFYNFIDYELHHKLEISSKNISEKFHESLTIGLALKKNITRIFYGQIGLYPHFDLIKKLIDNKNKLYIYTEDEKILNIFKIIEKFDDVSIFYKKKIITNYSSYFKVSRLDLLKMYSLSEIIFYIKKKLSPTFKSFNNLKHKVFVHLSTEANFLSIDKYLNDKWQSKILEVDLTKIKKLKSKDYQEFDKIFEATQSITNSHFHNNKYFKEQLKNEFKLFFVDYITCYYEVSKIFENLNSQFYFLTKIIRGPLMTSLYDYGKKNNKNFFWISHQHGHGIEISDIHDKTQITKEETLSDLLFVYSSVGKQKREQNKFINKKIKISNIGYHNNDYKFNKISKYDLIYISNLNQELAGHEISMSALNNFEKIKFEEKLIKEVFSQVNHKILFKEYPGGKTSNIKNNYIKNLIAPHENITYFNEWLNAENIYDKVSIIITSLPTSGLAGAIKTNKPLIFIDIKKMMPLRKDLVQVFEKKFFYLNFDENTFEKLKELLSNTLIEIEAKWESKKTLDETDFEHLYINNLPKDTVLDNLKVELNKFVV